MPQFVTNTMRVCTRDASGATYDAAVPVKPLFHNSSVLPTFEGSEEMCSETPFDVPWSMEDAAAAENPAAQFSLGCVPMWDGSPVDMNPVYPSDAYTAQLDNTDPGTFPFQPYTLFIHTELITHEKTGSPGNTDWGSCLGDQQQLQCASDKDCHSIEPTTVSLRCVHSVCVVDTGIVPPLSRSTPSAIHASSSCYAHRDCNPGGGNNINNNETLMCSGDGRYDSILPASRQLFVY